MARFAHCPTCNKPSGDAHRPFCSERCKEIDLGRWFSESYTLPTEEPLDEEALDQLIAALEADESTRH